MISDPWFFVVAAVAVFIVGMAKGGFGGSIGMVAVPLMALAVSPIRAAAIMLPILLLSDALALRNYWKKWDWANLKVLIPGALLGTALGTVSFRYLSADAVRVLVGVIATVYALHHFLRPGRRVQMPSKAMGYVWGLLAGFTSFGIHAGAPPAQAYLLPQRLHKTVYQATMVTFFFVVNWSKVFPYAWLGQLDGSNLMTSLILAPVAPLGVLVGIRLHDAVSGQLFYHVVNLTLLALGIKLIYDGLGS